MYFKKPNKVINISKNIYIIAIFFMINTIYNKKC